ncbi:GNAT family N-acetyltransferase [Microlunatus sp. GCM10028923]|uniref:GNAT family N-acetyltransferase n=1 Tax=Microlunatus sp. GCM10028923 TaxID=3273400 RepID=UPI0036168E33
MNALAEVYARIERGEYPPEDGRVRIVEPSSDRDTVVASFTAHFVVAAKVDESWARSYLPAGDFSAPVGPAFLSALEQRLGKRAGCLDHALLATGLPDDPDLELTRVTSSNHGRVERSLRHRDEVRTYLTEGGVLTVGRGLAGRWEAAFEVEPAHRGRGLGRRLIRAARHLVPDGAGIWCQVTPGNAASLRAVLAAGFRPVGSEVIFEPR